MEKYGLERIKKECQGEHSLVVLTVEGTKIISMEGMGKRRRDEFLEKDVPYMAQLTHVPRVKVLRVYDGLDREVIEDIKRQYNGNHENDFESVLKSIDSSVLS